MWKESGSGIGPVNRLQPGEPKKTLRLERRRNPAITEEAGNGSPMGNVSIPAREIRFQAELLRRSVENRQIIFSEWRVKVGGKQSSSRIGSSGLGQEVSGSLPNAQTCLLGSLINREYKDCRAKVHAFF